MWLLFSVVRDVEVSTTMSIGRKQSLIESTSQKESLNVASLANESKQDVSQTPLTAVAGTPATPQPTSSLLEQVAAAKDEKKKKG